MFGERPGSGKWMETLSLIRRKKKRIIKVNSNVAVTDGKRKVLTWKVKV